MTGFRQVADRMYRKNGLWAKVVRLHRKSLDGNWKPYWHLACGKSGEYVAFRSEDHRKSCDAHECAKGFVNGRY